MPATSPLQREPVLDVVRGVALFGVLAVNTLTIFRVSIFEQFLPEEMRPFTVPPSTLEHTIGSFVTYALEMKAVTLFSFLFGMGLAAQQERVRGISFARLATRRLGFLLIVGLVHLVLVWDGDILTTYALVGAIAAPVISRASPRVLAALAITCLVLHAAPLPYPAAFPNVDAIAEHVDAARHIYPFGSFRQVLAFRIVELRPIGALLVWIAPRTLGLFFLGAFAWRVRIFREERAGLLAKLAGAFFLGAGFLIWRRGPLDGFAQLSLALGYAAGLGTLFHGVGHRVLAAFAPLGRMALTCYLTQSIALGFVFYGYGLGLFGALGQAPALGIVVAIYVVQMVFAHLWFTRFRYGPFEWLWRSFTYGAWQSFRVGAGEAWPPPPR